MRISIVSPCHCAAPAFVRFLQALARLQARTCSWEAILVDDASPEDLREVLAGFTRSTPLPGVVCLRNPDNLGRAATRNAGIRRAQGDVVLMLDADILPEPDLLERLAARFRACPDPQRLAVRAHLVVEAAWQRRSLYARYLDSRSPGHRPGLDLADLSPRFFATGALAVARPALLEAGLFDQGFRHYGCEDEDLGIRLHHRGVRLAYALEAVAVDADGDSDLARVTAKFEAYARHSLPLLLAKHPGYLAEGILPDLEAPWRSLDLPGRLRKAALLLVLRPSLGRLLRAGLGALDARAPRGLSLRWAFRLMLACAYNRGRRARTGP